MPYQKEVKFGSIDKQRKEEKIFESFCSSSVSSRYTISMDCLETLPEVIFVLVWGFFYQIQMEQMIKTI